MTKPLWFNLIHQWREKGMGEYGISFPFLVGAIAKKNNIEINKQFLEKIFNAIITNPIKDHYCEVRWCANLDEPVASIENTSSLKNKAIQADFKDQKKDVAISVVNAQHLSQDLFLELFKNIFGRELSKATQNYLNRARKVRNHVIHGKTVSDAQMRSAIFDILEYSQAVNNEMDRAGNFKPFGDMRGFKGRAESLDTQTSKWLLKGLGFSVT